MTPSTIAVVDDHQLLSEVLTAALSGPEIVAVAVAPREPGELLGALIGLAPHLVLLDLDLGPDGDATAIIRPLAAAGIKVLVVSGITDEIRLALAVEQGAIGVHRKTTGFDALVATARRALSATGPLDPASDRVLLARLRAAREATAESTARLSALTVREAEALRALADGLSVQDMVRTWVVSEATVRSHVQAILRKLGVTSQLQAVLLALRVGWLGPAAGSTPGASPAAQAGGA